MVVARRVSSVNAVAGYPGLRTWANGGKQVAFWVIPLGDSKGPVDSGAAAMMDGRAEPDQPARAYLKAIADDPEALRRPRPRQGKRRARLRQSTAAARRCRRRTFRMLGDRDKSTGRNLKSKTFSIRCSAVDSGSGASGTGDAQDNPST
jgi:hypothetical protein